MIKSSKPSIYWSAMIANFDIIIRKFGSHIILGLGNYSPSTRVSRNLVTL